MMVALPMSPACKMWFTPPKISWIFGSRKLCVSEMTPIFIFGGTSCTSPYLNSRSLGLAEIVPPKCRVSRFCFLRRFLGFGFLIIARAGGFVGGRFGGRGQFYRRDKQRGKQPATCERVAEHFPRRRLPVQPA